MPIFDSPYHSATQTIIVSAAAAGLMRGSPSLVNGARLRTSSLRGSWVRIPPPALFELAGIYSDSLRKGAYREGIERLIEKEPLVIVQGERRESLTL